MTTQTHEGGARTGSDWVADIATALMVLLLEAMAVAVGLYVALVAAWDPDGTDENEVVVISSLIGGILLTALVSALVSHRAFRRRAPVTGVVQALVCAALVVGAAAMVFAVNDTPEPRKPALTTYLDTDG
ncbi:DUF6234 family protein [Streptomyces sp. NBC_00249]|uniref:DUF6234 family protein n=1 Tax=Streptomyces sp. NBC_00249 TaxID=2975690 RepID=UPI0022532B55|nr:DUF6234 family protein [Streptomyces sp. NBC_00249]MCX5194934.1 DUF6234 family protein [Streptomyces sp. NBC_00249]